MNIQVTQENLSRAISTVFRIASAKTTLPILSNILIKTENNLLYLMATNLDVAIKISIGAKINSEGSITVPAVLMQSFIASLPDGVINLDLDGNKLHIESAGYKSTVNGVDAEDFPVMPLIDQGNHVSFNSAEFKNALSRVVFAAASEDTRPMLSGVHLGGDGKVLKIAATDSYRLAEKKIEYSGEKIDLIVPASSLHELVRIYNDEETEISLTFNEQQLLIKLGVVELVTRLIDGNYPDYKYLMPVDFSSKAELSKKDFINIVKVSSLFARESAGSITIILDKEKSEVSIKSIASQVGENTAVASANVTSSGSITLNSKYLLEALPAFEGVKITIGFNDKSDAVLLKDEFVTYSHIIMPINNM